MTNLTQNALTPYTLTPAQQTILEAVAGRTEALSTPYRIISKGEPPKR